MTEITVRGVVVCDSIPTIREDDRRKTNIVVT